jgi:hypothetical protein
MIWQYYNFLPQLNKSNKKGGGRKHELGGFPLYLPLHILQHGHQTITFILKREKTLPAYGRISYLRGHSYQLPDAVVHLFVKLLQIIFFWKTSKVFQAPRIQPFAEFTASMIGHIRDF